MGHGTWCLGVVVCLAVPAAVRAQVAPVGVPAGVVRLELDGAFESWDTRWRDGEKESLGADLTSPALGADRIPALAASEVAIQRVSGLGSFRLNLGALTTDAQADREAVVLGLGLGLTRAITIFGRLPLVRARIQHSSDLDPTGANAGLNPGGVEQEEFFAQFEAALTTLSGRIAAGDYASDPGQLALAQSTLAGATALRDDLFELLSDPATASPVVPTASSEAGVALDARLDALQTSLATQLGVPGFTAAPTLPAAPLTEAELDAVIADPLGPVAMFTDESDLSFRGDGEVGVALTLVDRWDRGRQRGGFRTAVEGLVRLPTGERARTDRPLALGTGDGQTDVELRGTMDLGGGRWGLRVEGRYNRQLAADVAARVAPPGQPFPGPDRLAGVRLDPGDETSVALRPFFRLAPSLAIIGSAERWHHGADQFEYAAADGGIPGVDPSVLEGETDASATLLGIGLTYFNPGRLREGGHGLPVDAGWSYERVIAGSGGRVPAIHRIRARLRLYFGLW